MAAKSSSNKETRLARWMPDAGRLETFRKHYHLDRKPWPAVGAVLAGGAGLAVAGAIGAGELAIGAAAGYAAYRVMRDGLKPSRAARQGAKVAQGEAPR